MPDLVPAAVLPGAPAAAPAPAAPPAAAPQAPAKPVAQPTPVAAPKPGAPAAAPAPAAPAPVTVPLHELQQEREKRQALQAELESLKTTVSRIQSQQPLPGTQPVQPQTNVKEEMDKLWQTDPRAAVDRTIMMAVQWQDNVNAQVDGEASQLASKYADFNSYRDTAMRYVRALPLDQRSRPGIVEMAYLVTRGQNVDQIIAQNQEAMRQRFLTNPAEFQMPAGASAGSLVPAGTPTASEGEERAARAMKIPIDQYLKWKKS